MIPPLQILGIVAPVFAIVGAGAFARSRSWFPAESDKALLTLLLNLFVPCLILDVLLDNEAIREPSNLVQAPLVGFLSVAGGIAIAYLIADFLGMESPTRRSFAFAAGVCNYGYIPIPLCQALFDERTLGTLFVHNVGVELGIWTIAGPLLGGGGLLVAMKRALNVPFFTLVIAVALNLSGLGQWIPSFILEAASVIGACAIPVGILMMGFLVTDHIADFGFRSQWRPLSIAVAIRLGLIPVLLLMVAKWAPLNPEIKRIIVLESGMPAAMFAAALSRLFGGDPAMAVRVIFATSALSLITIPFWLSFALRFLGID